MDFHENCGVGSAIFWQSTDTSSSTPASVEVALAHKISTAVQSLSGNPRPYLIRVTFDFVQSQPADLYTTALATC